MAMITVIVPIYNIEKYLPACIDSILAQTFQDLEIILVDDGSPDGCSDICDCYAKRDRRVRVIHKKNEGLSCARNAGVELAKGDYLCFVDGDDLLCPEYCEELYSLIHNTDFDFSACGVCRFPDGQKPAPILTTSIPVRMNSVDYLRDQLNKKREFGVWNRLFRKEIFNRIQFMPKKIHEDVIFSADLALLQGSVIATEKQLYCYRQRGTGIVAESQKRCSPDRVFAGDYLVRASEKAFPVLYRQSVLYAISYPWMFVDRIYVDRTFRDNSEFLAQLRNFIKAHIGELRDMNELDNNLRLRMSLFSKSYILYGINAYCRLIRVYLFHILGKDAYKDGHGI